MVIKKSEDSSLVLSGLTGWPYLFKKKLVIYDLPSGMSYRVDLYGDDSV